MRRALLLLILITVTIKASQDIDGRIAAFLDLYKDCRMTSQHCLDVTFSLAESYEEKARRDYYASLKASSQSNSTITPSENVSNAIALYKQIITAYEGRFKTDFSKAYYRVARLYNQYKQSDSANVYYLSLAKKYPSSTYSSEANYYLAQTAYDEGNTEEALRYYSAIRDLSRTPKKECVELSIAIGQFRQAIQLACEYNRFIDRNSIYTSSYNSKALRSVSTSIASEKGDARKLLSKSFAVFFQEAEGKRKQGKYLEAVKLLDSYIYVINFSLKEYKNVQATIPSITDATTLMAKSFSAMPNGKKEAKKFFKTRERAFKKEVLKQIK